MIASPRSDEARTRPMRSFTTAGPVVAARHYCIPPLQRLDLDEVLDLVREQKYFVLHAPRQTGKTSALLALRDHLNAEGYRCVYANVESAQAMRDDVSRATQVILGQLASWARSTLNDVFLEDAWGDIFTRYGPGAFGEALTRWAEADATPLVLLLDEIDALVGDSLLSVMRQLRTGYVRRPSGFPHSVVLCGVRDVSDYRMDALDADQPLLASGSPFNFVSESLRLGDFSDGEVRGLLQQHTDETGQSFSPAALESIWTQTQGQPWLVNALAHEACFRAPEGRDRSRVVDKEAVLAAREQLVLRRRTHIRQLAERLREDRVRRVVEPLLSGGERRTFDGPDLEYARDLGLVARDPPVRIANAIYAEVVPRELGWIAQQEMDQDVAWYVDSAGALDMTKLMEAFQAFFRMHSEHWRERFQYQEAWHQLLLQAFLQRVVNGGGRVEREYGLGRGRTDLLIEWPHAGGVQRVVVECKLRDGALETVIARGVEQTAAYMDRCSAASGHLVIFDRSPHKGWNEKIFCRREESASGRTITVWGM